MDLERVYDRLPAPLQNLACSVEGSRINRTRFSKGFFRKLAQAEERSTWGQERIMAYRDGRLQHFLRDHVAHVPFYKGQLSALGIRRDDLTVHTLSELPTLDKGRIQRNAEDLISPRVPLRLLRPAHTSGTTGAGLRFHTTVESIQEQWAIWWRYRKWHGLSMDAWCGYFGGRSVVPIQQSRPPFWRFNYPGKQILFGGYHLSPQNLPAYVAALRKHQPPWLHGYPSLLTLLASYIAVNNLDIGYQVGWITTAAENLMAHQVATISRAFGVRPKQHYGMAEGVANFSECTEGVMHVDEDFSYVEFLPNPDALTHRVVGTNFTNPGALLARYEMYDHVQLQSGSCRCGLPGRLVKTVDGRKEDYVVLPGGARIGRLDHIFKDLVNIREAQIVQHDPTELVFKIVRGGDYGPADEARVLQEAQQRLGQDIRIRIAYCHSLERSSTGKLRFVVSNLQQQSSSL